MPLLDRFTLLGIPASAEPFNRKTVAGLIQMMMVNHIGSDKRKIAVEENKSANKRNWEAIAQDQQDMVNTQMERINMIDHGYPKNPSGAYKVTKEGAALLDREGEPVYYGDGSANFIKSVKQNPTKRQLKRKAKTPRGQNPRKKRHPR